MGKLTVILLTGRSGAEGSFAPGDELDLPLMEAISLIDAGSAKPKNKKNYEAALKHIEQAKAEQERIEEENRVRIEKERYENELTLLYAKVIELEALLAGVRLDAESKQAAIDALRDREGRVTLKGDETK